MLKVGEMEFGWNGDMNPFALFSSDLIMMERRGEERSVWVKVLCHLSISPKSSAIFTRQ